MPDYYIDRVKRNVSLCLKHQLLKPSDRLLELGTGWVHWEALTTRLFFDFEATLYDVWDNRQFDALKSYLRQLASMLKREEHQFPGDVSNARRLISQICELKSFEEVYKLLGFKYIVDPLGEMKSLPDKAFKVIISAGVLEHVHADSVWNCVQGMSRVLKPGGHCIHSINITDHLYLYDCSASPKQYLSYSDRIWRLFFQNKVQYINRFQRSEWLSMFLRAGFDLISEEGAYCSVKGLQVNRKYHALPQQDLECTTLDILLRKRAACGVSSSQRAAVGVSTLHRTRTFQ